MIEQEIERRKLEEVASEYRTAGYDVTVLPRGKSLPTFLQGTEPDLLALSLNDKVVVEIKVIRDLAASSDLPDLARRIDKQPGWRFELITVGSSRESPAERPRWRSEKAMAKMLEAKRLAEGGHYEAAFLLAYAAMEALLYEWARSWGSVLAKQPTTLTVAKRMVVTGALARRDLFRLESLLAKRNALAHGVSSPSVTGNDVRALLALGNRVQRAPQG